MTLVGTLVRVLVAVALGLRFMPDIVSHQPEALAYATASPESGRGPPIHHRYEAGSSKVVALRPALEDCWFHALGVRRGLTADGQ